MTARTSLPGDLSERPFSVVEARIAGVRRIRLAANDLAAPFFGARMPVVDPAATPSPRERAIAALVAYRPLLKPDEFFSHASAAVLWGLPLPWRLFDGPVHVSTVWPARAPRVSGAIGHAMRNPPIVTLRGGWRTQSAADSWCSLATLLDVDALVAAGDRLLDRKHPLCDRAEIEQAVRRWGSRRGARRLNAALPLLRARTESPRETSTRLLLVRSGLPEPVVNHEVRDGLGRLVAIIDLAFPEFRTGVDYEGRHHAEDEEQFARDAERFNALQLHGWISLRRTARMSRTEFADSVRIALRGRGWRG